MRFVVPNFCYPDSFVDNVTSTLRSMGHEVVTVPLRRQVYTEKQRYFINLFMSRMIPNYKVYQLKWLSTFIKKEKFDVLLSLTQVIDEEILLECRRKGVRTAVWWGDTPANMTGTGLLCEGWDHIFIKDRYAAFKMRTLGLNAEFLPEAMNPQWHRKVAANTNDSIVFAGNVYDYRHFLLRKLIKNGYRDRIRLYGSGVPSWSDPEVESVYQGRYIIKEEKSRIFGEASVCINSTAMSEGNSINCRAFEICGAWGLQILEYRESVHDCFEVGKEILVYNDFDELVQLIDKYSDIKESRAIREAGYRRVNSEHTYTHRLEYIIKSISA
jgi:spore maturation protein CgeB